MPHPLGVYDRFVRFLTWIRLNAWVLQLFIKPIFEWSLRLPWLLAGGGSLHGDPGPRLLRWLSLILNIARMLEILFGYENLNV
jgi:hypothetical protein